jgi:single-stranded-DNA-specific exonuclease
MTLRTSDSTLSKVTPELEEVLQLAKNHFQAIPVSETIRVISHIDADGIASAALLVQLLQDQGRKHLLSTVKQLSEEVLSQLEKEPHQYYIFSDLGSGQYTQVKEKLGEKHVIILDHHTPPEKEITHKKILQVNPHLTRHSGNEVAGAGIVYLFLRTYDSQYKKLAHIALIGALGDMQEPFTGLNQEILQDAEQAEKIVVEKGIKFFGRETKNLHKLIQHAVFIPGVGDEDKALRFLHELGVNSRKNGWWRKFHDLSQEEMQKLTAGIILRRKETKHPEDILGLHYILPQEKQGTSFRTAREFSTLLNACGRLNKASLGIGACLGDEGMKRKALQYVIEYKKELMQSLRWYHSCDDGGVSREEKCIIINAGEVIKSTLIGTLTSIIAKSPKTPPGTFVLGLAQASPSTTKISLRIASRTPEQDARVILKEICMGVQGESGGHGNAAGALIESSKIEQFVTDARRVLIRN